MEHINGKILVFSDLHLGLKNASKSRLNIAKKVIDNICQSLKENNIENVIFLGDWHHLRSITENSVLNVSYNLMKKLSTYAKIYIILGNHDIYMKDTVDINSMIIFKDLKNVKIFDKSECISINGNNSIFIPWLGNINYDVESFDMVFGHFEVSRKYLIESYIQNNSKNAKLNNNVINIINDDFNVNESANVGDYVGDFINIAKKNGIVFSGHIHGHKEFLAKQRKFIFVGDPYQQNLGEKQYDNGFYIINENNTYEFHIIANIPKHIELYISKIINNFDQFDFSIVKNNIIHKIYDIEIDNVLDQKISQKIIDNNPYEELTSDYIVKSESNNIKDDTIELIKNSKIDYIKKYIENIDSKTLEEQDLQQDCLFDVLKTYYNNVTKEI